MSLSRFLFRLLLGRRLPQTRGRLTVAGLRGPLQIHRDRWGIPYIEAGNDDDAFFGLGFCHGQDRAFQLEVLLRAIRGTLSELVGVAALPIDRMSRRIGFAFASRQQLACLDADVRAQLVAFAAGVNAGTTAGLPRRPHEFVLLKAQPTPWTPEDSLGVVKLISFTLASNWDQELARFHILCADGPDAVTALEPDYPPEHPVVSPPGGSAGPAFDALLRDLALFRATVGSRGASNNWAISGSRTASGRPLLANDPHLDARLPCHWYFAHLRTPDWAVAGASMVGGPAIIAGHNDHAAWGVTAGLIDNTDLFREQIGPDGASVREADHYTPCPVRTEVIRVKGADSVTENVLMTPRGPILGPSPAGNGEMLSFCAVWLQPRPLRGLLAVHRAKSFDDFRRLLADWPATSQNVVYADQGGTIGWQMVGLAPRRRKGFGSLPQPGWDPAAGWESELLPFEELPWCRDPAEGFIATANTKPRADGAGPYLGADWLDGYRLGAITRALAARSAWDLAGVLALQMDQRPLSWEEMSATILALSPAEADARRGLGLLRAWDGRLSVDSPAAAVFELFVNEMTLRVLKAQRRRATPMRPAKRWRHHALQHLQLPPHGPGVAVASRSRRVGSRSPGRRRWATHWPPSSAGCASNTDQTRRAGPGGASAP